ncbi:type II toxin-antitoxin system RelE/ParE family toxin [Candidatus Regiella insecticola]|uniref:Toxin-antitoxin system toxin component RelE n=1 Tax=Candidatus Regiella insecticola TaxID=138073 RepID=A0A6L2ZMH2_9ENTR|nr:type II toxin-antitoxin system RelE/ParE family toxin [Candidatus Regiella insecticola]GFN45946.1 toxin-antitoxin system toxin component RelE [Candidatus Regiella insecticola]
MFELIYHPEVVQELENLPAPLKGKTAYLLDRLEKEGNRLRYPLSDSLRDGLFELRVGGGDIARIIYTFAKGRRIYILRSFVKKTPKIPPKEMAIAFNRLKEFTK